MNEAISHGLKPKTIRRIIRRKLDEWLETIEDLGVRELAKRDVFVTGGSIASMLIGERIKDFDLYFKTEETVVAIANYYTKKFIEINRNYSGPVPQVRIENIVNLKGETERRVVIWVQSAGAVGEGLNDSAQMYSYFEATDNAAGDAADEYLVQMVAGLKAGTEEGTEKPSYRPVFLSQNAITLTDKVQLVIRFFGQPADIYKNYDFAHVCQSYSYADDKLDLDNEALTCLLSRTLLYRGSLYPIASIFRIKKFVERGWRVSAGQMLKIAYQTSKVDFNNPRVLREQLTGVDQAYMHQVIEMMQDHQAKMGTNDIDETYLCKLIDFLFEGSDAPTP